MIKNKRNEEHKAKLWNSLSPAEQKRQDKKVLKSFQELVEKARAKGALIEGKPS
jgi:hypothetical protein